MAGIYFSYLREDRHLASQLVADLEAAGHPVPWLHRMLTDWRTPPPLDIGAAGRVVVLWTRASLASKWLREEALDAAAAGKLVQIGTADVSPSEIPLGLRTLPILEVGDLDGIARAVSDDAASEALPTSGGFQRLQPTPHGQGAAHEQGLWSIEGPIQRSDELSVEALLSKRVHISRLDDAGSVAGADDDTTVARRPAYADTPRTEPGGARAAPEPLERKSATSLDGVSSPPIFTGLPRRPVAERASPSRQASAIPHTRMEPSASRKSGVGLAALATVLAAGMAAVLVWKSGLLESLAGAATKLLAFLKWNVMPPVAAQAQPDAEVVDCSVFAPPSAAAGRSMLVQVFLHAPEQLERAEAIAARIDKGSRLRSIATLQTEVGRGQRLAVTLDGAGLACDAPTREVVWRGHPQAVSFRVTIPAGTSHGAEFFPVVRVSIEGVPVGFLEFAVACEIAASGEVDATGRSARRYRYAFLSHAWQDRREVLKFARALSAARIDFFQDILSLEPGDDWEARLLEEIDRCDVFYLFWSEHAAASQMVRREAEYAHQRASAHGTKVPDITPIRLDASPLPRHPPHPAWMPKIHFDDGFRKLIEGQSGS